jgi:hypothetical protein
MVVHSYENRAARNCSIVKIAGAEERALHGELNSPARKLRRVPKWNLVWLGAKPSATGAEKVALLEEKVGHDVFFMPNENDVLARP